MAETIRFLHRRMNMGCPKVLSKALELDRRAAAVCRSLGKGAVCRGAVCLELACRLHDKSLDKEELQRRSGATKQIYQQTFQRISNVLKVKASRFTVHELAVKFGMLSFISFAETTLKTYKRRVLQTLPAAQRVRTSFAGAIYPAAVFFVCVQKRKARIDKKKLVDLVNADMKTFTRVCTHILDVCHDTVGVRKVKRKAKNAMKSSVTLYGNGKGKTMRNPDGTVKNISPMTGSEKKKRKRGIDLGISEQQIKDGDFDSDEGGESVVAHDERFENRKLALKEKTEYFAWRNRQLKKAKQPPKKRRKQTNISSMFVKNILDKANKL
eukprot:g2067.t1